MKYDKNKKGDTQNTPLRNSLSLGKRQQKSATQSHLKVRSLKNFNKSRQIASETKIKKCEVSHSAKYDHMPSRYRKKKIETNDSSGQKRF
ncbi:hypothetical protein TNCV_3610511 [Trichonephila clavipes]|nr:hypothetical protein TNCV_3610511 [Trichonephila clavipes]